MAMQVIDTFPVFRPICIGQVIGGIQVAILCFAKSQFKTFDMFGFLFLFAPEFVGVVAHGSVVVAGFDQIAARVAGGEEEDQEECGKEQDAGGGGHGFRYFLDCVLRAYPKISSEVERVRF